MHLGLGLDCSDSHRNVFMKPSSGNLEVGVQPLVSLLPGRKEIPCGSTESLEPI